MAAFWILLGVVVGFGGKYVFDLQLAKRNRLRGDKRKWSVEFLAAVGRLAQAVAAWCSWQQELRHEIAVDPDEGPVADPVRFTKRSIEKRARSQYARTDVYRGRSALRLPVPDVADDPSDYWELRTGEPGEGRHPREHALRKQIGA